MVVLKFALFFCNPEFQSDSDYEDYDNCGKKTGNSAAPEYKRLIAIHAGNAKKKCLRQVLRIRIDRARRLSLSEQELERAASLYAADVVRYLIISFLLLPHVPLVISSLNIITDSF